MKRDELIWLAGLLEGEGCFRCAQTPVIKLSMTDKEIVTKVAKLIKVKKVRKYSHRNPNWNDYYEASIYGKDAIVLMEKLFPLMGKRRQKAIQNVLDLPEVARRQYS